MGELEIVFSLRHSKHIGTLGIIFVFRDVVIDKGQFFP